MVFYVISDSEHGLGSNGHECKQPLLSSAGNPSGASILCKKRFMKKSRLLQHLVSVHKVEIPDSKIVCELCGDEFISQEKCM